MGRCNHVTNLPKLPIYQNEQRPIRQKGLLTTVQDHCEISEKVLGYRFRLNLYLFDSGRKTVSTRFIWGLALFFGSAGISFWLLRPDPPPPRLKRANVVLIIADTLRADHLGCYGYPRPTSPNLDRFARENLLFLKNRAQAACTFPSMNSLLTSRYPSVFIGQEDGSMGIPKEIPSLAKLLNNYGYDTVAISSSPIVRNEPSEFNPHGGFGEGFDAFYESMTWNPAEMLVNRARELAPGLKPPYFLYLHFMDPHGPYQPPITHRYRFTRPYQDKDYIAAGNPNTLAEALSRDGRLPEIPARDLEHLKDLYDEEIAYFDYQFGRLMRFFEERGLLENTIVVVASDHGEAFAEHGDIKHCRGLYDTLIYTPLMIRLPGGQQGTFDALTQNLDIVPSLLDWTGIRSNGFGLEGLSLVPLVESGEAINSYAFSAQTRERAVTSSSHKLIVKLRSQEPLLFDLTRDPGELLDISASQPDLVETMRREIERWMTGLEKNGVPGSILNAEEEMEEKLRSLGYIQ